MYVLHSVNFWRRKTLANFSSDTFGELPFVCFLHICHKTLLKFDKPLQICHGFPPPKTLATDTVFDPHNSATLYSDHIIFNAHHYITFHVMYICDQAYENRPCERKLHRVIFWLISFVPNALSHFCKLQEKAH